MSPGHRDYNRCFAPPHDDCEGRRALAFMAHFAREHSRKSFEAVIDLHNNTGLSPAYGVACGITDEALNLTNLFGDRYIDSDIRLRTVVEFTMGYCPSITVECGTAGDPLADAAALAGLLRFLSVEQLNLTAPPARHIQILSRPVRVHLREGLDVVFAQHEPREAGVHASVVFRADMPTWNLKPVAAGTCIGWMRPGGGWPLDARGADGLDVSHELFHQDGNQLRTRQEMIPAMMTADPRVARADCLFYAMLPHAARPRN